MTITNPKQPIDQVLWECFRHFAALDQSNAAVHCAPVRYSPITFRLAEHLWPICNNLAPHNVEWLGRVVNAIGAYEEDRGR